jgi:hypothetical protein
VYSTGFPVLVEGIPGEEWVMEMSCGWAHVACAMELKSVESNSESDHIHCSKSIFCQITRSLIN